LQERQAGSKTLGISSGYCGIVSSIYQNVEIDLEVLLYNHSIFNCAKTIIFTEKTRMRTNY